MELYEIVNEKIKILDVCEVLNISMENQGSSYLGHCIFHSDSTPSFRVSVGDNVYKCFGCATKGGGPYSLIKTYLEFTTRRYVNKNQIVEWIKLNLNIDLGVTYSAVKKYEINPAKKSLFLSKINSVEDKSNNNFDELPKAKIISYIMLGFDNDQIELLKTINNNKKIEHNFDNLLEEVESSKLQ